jgi:diguanylate cyclase (GGDEF)-like protein/PAS domain S-box-containing protein
MNLLLPHGYCINWTPSILWTHVISNAVVAIAYFSIPFVLAYIAYKRKDFNFRPALILFSGFIISCGLTHLTSIIMVWNPIYIFDNAIMAITAILSLGTALYLLPQIPKILSIPSSAQLTDINTRLEAEIELKNQFEKILHESESRFRLSFDYAAIGMGLVDLNGRWLKVNKSLCLMLGMTEDELLALTFQDITHPDDLELDLKYVNDLLIGSINHYQLEKRYFHKLGNIIWVNLSVSIVRDDRNNPVHFVSQIENITQRKTQEAEISYLAYHDTLTKLPNRRLILDRLEQAMLRAQREKSIISVLFLDIDHFKKINDTYGHDYGDMALTRTAEKLDSNIRKTDILGRQGGDEFVIVLSDIKHRADITSVVENITKSFSAPFQINGCLIAVTLSIGISIYESDSNDTLKDLIKKADMALYEAKEAGRNGFRFYSETPN